MHRSCKKCYRVAQTIFFDENIISFGNITNLDDGRSVLNMRVPVGISFPYQLRIDVLSVLSFPVPDVKVRSGYGVWGSPLSSDIEFAVIGNTTRIAELHNSNYRARVWFTNLRHGGSGPSRADLLKIEIVRL